MKENLTLSELNELLNTVKGIITKYQEELTTYARMNGDSSFERISNSEKIKFDKMNEFVKFKEELEYQIENMIYEEYIK